MRALRRHRGIITWLAVVGYVLVASGLPLPIGVVPPVNASGAAGSATARRLAGKDRSRPFPCMDKPCGCATAEQCFTRCCCNTPAETLAWARAHGVEPGVLAALELRVQGGRRTDVRSAAKATCCSDTRRSETTSQRGSRAERRAESSCCAITPAGSDLAAATTDLPVPGIRGTAAASATPPQAAREARVAAGSEPPARPAGEEPAGERPARSVTLRAMLACGGIVAEWFVAGSALPPPRVEVAVVVLPVDVTIVADMSGAGLRAAPDAPPPRAA